MITRATFSLAHYVQIGAPLVKPGGRLLALKGPHLEESQWQEAVDQATEYHLQPPEKREYALPLTEERRLLVMWEKLGSGQPAVIKNNAALTEIWQIFLNLDNSLKGLNDLFGF